jgi:aspartyl-tRNA(Asn)/glutamyl-tRNA(Gln) amidotransferase subunit A
VPDQDLSHISSTGLAAMIADRQISPVELADHLLKRIAKLDSKLNAFSFFDPDHVRAEARAAEAAVQRGDKLGPLHGVPVAMKDGIAVKGMPSTSGSRIFADRISPSDGPVMERLRAAGAIPIGKTTMPEFGHKAVTDSGLHGITRNPHNLDYSPGGSTGGGAAAVAAGFAPLAMGSDGGGSIRIPASFSGIYGLKPSLGRAPFAPAYVGFEQLACSGPLAFNVADIALTMDIISGPSEEDLNTLPATGISYVKALEDFDVSGMRLAWSPDLGVTAVDGDVAAVAEEAAARLEAAGCVIEPLREAFPNVTQGWYDLFCVGFAASRREDFDAVRHLMDDTFIAIVEHGLSLSGTDVFRAGNERREALAKTAAVFERYDALLMPTVAIPPLAIGRCATDPANEYDGGLKEWGALTFTFNMTGQPGMSVPAGFVGDNLPVGLQIVGRRYDETTVLRLARAYEAASPPPVRPPAPFG